MVCLFSSTNNVLMFILDDSAENSSIELDNDARISDENDHLGCSTDDFDGAQAGADHPLEQNQYSDGPMDMDIGDDRMDSSPQPDIPREQVERDTDDLRDEEREDVFDPDKFARRNTSEFHPVFKG